MNNQFPHHIMEFIHDVMVADDGNTGLNDIQVEVLSQSWHGKSYQAIAAATGYDYDYIKQVGSQLWRRLSEAIQAKVTKRNLKAQLLRAYSQYSQLQTTDSGFKSQQSRVVDWGMAIDAPHFYGREREQAMLKHWILNQHCRFISLLGMGGIGKSSLAYQLSQQIQDEFEVVIWRSLKSAPKLSTELDGLLARLTSDPNQASKSIEAKLKSLLAVFRKRRCLLILDNFEVLLEEQEKCGKFKSSYQDYKELLEYTAGIDHQSCLLLTSRDKPQELDCAEGDDYPVRMMYLEGLDIATSQKIASHKGLKVSDKNLDYLVRYYRGNPLALKIVATSILELFSGDVEQFLKQTRGMFKGISKVFSEQWQRLSPLEQSILYWLAINHEPTTIQQLEQDILPAQLPTELLEALESLKQRSLIETTQQRLTGAIAYILQPVVMEFLLQNFVRAIAKEIITQSPKLFLLYTVLKVNAKDEVRGSQRRLILKPLVKQLRVKVGSQEALIESLKMLLDTLKCREFSQDNYGAGNFLNLLCFLKADITSFDFANLYIRQAILDNVVLRNVDFSGSTFQDCIFAHAFGGVVDIDFSPDGTMFATGDTSGGVAIWAPDTMKPLARCKGHNVWTWSLAFHPTQPILASSGDERKIYLWDTNTGDCITFLQGHSSLVFGLKFSPDGLYLITCSNDTTLKYWEVSSGRCVATLEGHNSSVWSAAFTADGRNLFSVGEDNCIRYWDLQTGECLKIIEAHKHWIMSLDLSPDDRYLATASVDGTIKIWETHTYTCVKTLTDHKAPAMSVAFSPDGKFLASGGYDQTVRVWTVTTGICRKVFRNHKNRIWTVAFHPDGDILASGGDDRSIRFWHLPTGEQLQVAQGYSNDIYALRTNGDGSIIATAHEDEAVRLWFNIPEAIATNTSPPSIMLTGHQHRILTLEFSPEGTLLATGSLDRSIKIWDVSSHACFLTLQGHMSWIWDVSFHPNGQLLASASYDRTVKLWDLNQGICTRTLKGHDRSAFCVAFSPDGLTLVSSGFDGKINLWVPESGELLNSWHAHDNRIRCVEVSPDGRYLASAGEDSRIILWDLQSGQQLQIMQGHRQHVLHVSFSADGHYIFSGSTDHTIKQWDINTGKCLKTFYGHEGRVWSVVPYDRDQVVSCSQDETVRFWSLVENRMTYNFEVPRPYKGMNVTDVKGLSAIQYNSLRALGAVGNQPMAMTE